MDTPQPVVSLDETLRAAHTCDEPDLVLIDGYWTCQGCGCLNLNIDENVFAAPAAPAASAAPGESLLVVDEVGQSRHLILRGFKTRTETEAFLALLERPQLGDAAVRVSAWKRNSRWHLELSATFYLLLMLGCPGAGRKMTSEDSHRLHTLKAQLDDMPGLDRVRELGAGKIEWDEFERQGGITKNTIGELINKIVLAADASFCTPSLLEREQSFKSRSKNAKAIVVDEAGAMTRADLASVHGNTLLPFLCAGDDKQLPPIKLMIKEHDEHGNFNRHAEDGKISALTWLKIQGLPVFRLRVQLRMAIGMFDIVQKHIYAKDVTLKYGPRCAINEPQHEPGRKLEALLQEQYGVTPARDNTLEGAFLNVQGSSCIVNGVTASKMNLGQVNAALSLLRDLVQDKGVNPSSIGIITPYSWNVQILEKKLKQEANACLTGIQPPKTVDSYQGQEADIMVFIMVGTKKSGPGFTTDEQRLTVALSRQRCGLLLVGDIEVMGNLGAPKGRNRGAKNNAMKEAEVAKKAIKTQSPTGEDTYINPGVLRAVLKDLLSAGRVADYVDPRLVNIET